MSDAMTILHVYPQSENHDDLRIHGEAESLRRLARALTEAADEGAATLTSVMTGDGEGYHVDIETKSEQVLMRASRPYAQLGLPWDWFSYADYMAQKARADIAEAEAANLRAKLAEARDEVESLKLLMRLNNAILNMHIPRVGSITGQSVLEMERQRIAKDDTP